MLRVFYNNEFTKTIVIDDRDTYHHLAIVLRIKRGDEIYLVKQSQVAKVSVIEVTKDTIVTELIELFEENNELEINLTLGFGPLKGDNTQLVVQKAVELGAAQIDMINFKRNISKFDSKKAEKKRTKFEKIILGACNQSRRNLIPKLNLDVNLTLDYLSQFDLVIVCYENESANHLTSYSDQIQSSTNVLVLIGPEGGIDESEIELVTKSDNTINATLGKRILRAETASISSLAIIASMIEGKSK